MFVRDRKHIKIMYASNVLYFKDTGEYHGSQEPNFISASLSPNGSSAYLVKMGKYIHPIFPKMNVTVLATSRH